MCVCVCEVCRYACVREVCRCVCVCVRCVCVFVCEVCRKVCVCKVCRCVCVCVCLRCVSARTCVCVCVLLYLLFCCKMPLFTLLHSEFRNGHSNATLLHVNFIIPKQIHTYTHTISERAVAAPAPCIAPTISCPYCSSRTSL